MSIKLTKAKTKFMGFYIVHRSSELEVRLNFVIKNIVRAGDLYA